MSAEDDKAARLSAALRANLARRKDQARARKAAQAQEPAAPDQGGRAPAERASPEGTIVPDDEAG